MGYMICDLRAQSQKKKSFLHPVGAVDETAQLENHSLGLAWGNHLVVFNKFT